MRQPNSYTNSQLHSMYWRPPIQGRRNGICWRIVKSLLSNCSEMRILGTYWKTWYFIVSEQTWSCCLQVDQSMWQTLSTFDLILSSHMWIQTTLSCGKYSTTMEIRIVSGLWFCRRSGRLTINIRWTLVHFRKSHVCASKLGVQETDFSFTQFYRCWKNFSRCMFYAWMESQLLIFGIWW